MKLRILPKSILASLMTLMSFFAFSQSNPDASNISISSGTLSPVFSSGTLTYSVSVPFSVSSVSFVLNTVETGPIAATAEIRLLPVAFAPITVGVATSSQAINVGLNEFKFRVTSFDGGFAKTYSVNVTRAAASTVKTLSNLTLSNGAFAPSFASGTLTGYSLAVPFATSSGTVTPTATDPLSSIRVRVNGGAYSTVASGSPSGSLAYNVGANVIDVEVTAEDLSTQVYQITVTRAAASTVSTLSAMVFSAGAIAPSFASGTTAYSFSVANAVTSTTVTSTLTDLSATMQVRVNGGSFTTVASGVASGALALNVGSNTVDVRITAEDGATITTYTTTITRAASTISTLSALTLSAGTLAPSFATGTLSYTASVANAVSSMTVTPTVTDITATIQVRVNGGAYSSVASASASGSLSLNVGANTIDVLVTAQDGLTTTTYTITVTRASVSTDASLSNIVVSSAFGSAFASGTFSYTVNVPFSVSTFSYTATVNQVAATIQSRTNANPYATIASGAIQTLTGLPVGTTGIDIQVTAEDAVTVLTYHIDFIRAPASTVSSLSALSMSTGVLAPVFASGTFAYTSSVVFATSSLTVTPTATSSVSTIRVRVNGGAYAVVTSATASASLALNLGANTIDVQVTAEDGVTISTYSITVTRLSDVSTLTSMVFNAGTLSPVFASGTFTYTSSVSFSTTTITVTPTVTLASNATIRVRVNGGAYVALASGVTSAALALNVGANTVDVEVTSEDGTSITVYTNTITRTAVSTNADLSALVLSAGTLSPVFASGTITYSAGSVNQASITFTPTVAQLNATMTYSLNGGASVVITSGATSAALALNMGANTLVVTVTAEDGTTIKTYTVNITRISVSSNAYLSNLVSSTGALNTAFNKFDIDYETYVLIATNSLTVTPTAEDPTATIQVRINNTGFSPEPYVTVASGAASPVMTLQEGDNMIDVTVTAQDGVTIINYRIKVSREASWVSGGGGGGLESRSLGDAVAKRIFNKAINSENGPVDYGKLPQVQFRDVQNRVQGAEPSKVSLTSIMPDITSKGYVAYNSSPKDLTSITNAKEVLAFDFTANKEVKAVAFATKTLGELYDHTKPICDRLKGATLLGVETVKVQGLEFIKYSIKNENGQKEYATSFSVGTKAGRPDFSLQSIYLTQDYANDETMYNFQLWAGSTSLVTDMVADILTKLKAIAPVNVIKSSVLPTTYVESGKREGQNVNLVVKNATANTSGYFKLEDKATETSASSVVRNIPFTINTNGKTNVIIPMDDKYESTLTMYVGGEVKDVVYMSDGTWAVDYNKATTVLSNFNVTNDSKRTYSADEYPLFRNVELKANSSDFVSVVKLLRGGGAAADLNAFKGLKFSASGGYNLHVTLIKNGIVDYRSQYAADVQLELGQQDYYIALDKFTSASTSAKIDPKDITSIVFTVEVGTGRNSPISTTLSNVAFTKEDLNYLSSLEAKEIAVYPNPVSGNRITVNFSSAKAAELSLRVTDMNGKVITLKQVQAVKGMNTVQVPVSTGLKAVHIISLDGADIKYKSTKVMITN